MSRSRRLFLSESAAAIALLHPGLRAFAGEHPKKVSSPFLEGNFAPVREEFTEEKLKVTGTLPKGLEGMFVRNGPNPQFDPISSYHWFDGDGMVHGVRIRDGVASYRNRYVRTEKYADENKAGKALYRGILDVPDLRELAAGKNPYKNPANTALVYHHDKLLALWEVGEPYELTLPELGTVGPTTFGGKLRQPFTAHPKVDPVTGELLFFGYVPNRPVVLFGTLNKNGEWIGAQPVKLEKPAMIHDFVVTTNYALFPAWPQTFDMARMLKGKSPWFFDKAQPTRWVVVPRKGQNKPKVFEAKTGFAFHLLNAWEHGDEITIIGCRYRRFPGVVSFGEKDEDKTPNMSIPYQWALNLQTQKLTEGPLHDFAVEFPRHNETLVGRQVRYGYLGVGAGDFFDGLRKLDLKSGTYTQHTYGQGRFGGEGVFVPKPDAKGEDGGWVLTFVYDKAADKSELLVMDAADFAAKPLARVHLPTRVPYGFHGVWVAGV
jgi:carotenoid cleavage dioxygenase